MLKISDTKLPKEVLAKENLRLLAHAAYVYNKRAHIGLRNTKTRSEVNRTTKKVYKQKGTGGARHGSRRANLFVGGGVVFGPRAVKRVVDLSKNIRRAAKLSALSVKNANKEVLVISGLSKISKTKEAAEFLKSLKAKRFTFLISDKSLKAYLFLKNLKNAKTVNFQNANAFDILNGGTILIDEEVFTEKVSPASAKATAGKKVIKESNKPAVKTKARKGAKTRSWILEARN